MDCEVSTRRLNIDENRNLCHRNRSSRYGLCNSPHRTLIVIDGPASYRPQQYLFDGVRVFSCHRLCCIDEIHVVIHACSMHNSCWGCLERLGQNVFHSRRSWGYESDGHVLASQYDDAVSTVPR